MKIGTSERLVFLSSQFASPIIWTFGPFINQVSYEVLRSNQWTLWEIIGHSFSVRERCVGSWDQSWGRGSNQWWACTTDLVSVPRHGQFQTIFSLKTTIDKENVRSMFENRVSQMAWRVCGSDSEWEFLYYLVRAHRFYWKTGLRIGCSNRTNYDSVTYDRFKFYGRKVAKLRKWRLWHI